VSQDQDWRLRIELAGSGGRAALDRLLASGRGETGSEMRPEVPRDVAITHDGNDRLFAYAATREEITATRAAMETVARRDGVKASSDVSHWDQDVDAWVQVDPPLTGAAQQQHEAAIRDAGRPESRTMVASSGKMVRAEVEQTMREWAEKLGLRCEIIEHPHLLTTQLAFTVTGPKRQVDEFAEGLRAEELATMRAERTVMLSPL
jgi:hypothetical protein